MGRGVHGASAQAATGPLGLRPEPASGLDHSAGVPLRVIDMFAGIGGFSLGLHRAGRFETVAVAELDAYASKVLALRFPNAPNVGDVTTAEYPDADIICAGFPCQDISFAGAGAGLAGARSGLWREVVRAVRMVRPRFTLLENVAALLSRGMGTVLGDLAEVGHDAQWDCIPAGAVGAPHVRDRIWILAQPQHSYADGIGSHRAEVHLEGEAKPAHKQVCISGPLGSLLADSARELRNRRGIGAEQNWRAQPANGGKNVADAERLGQSGSGQPVVASGPASGEDRQAANVESGGIGSIWAVEPNVGRVAHGVPSRVDRLRCLGNAVVPKIPELIGRAILASMNAEAA